MQRTLHIRSARQSDYKLIADLFTLSVHKLTGSFYDADARKAWAPIPADYAGWKTRLAQSTTFIAEYGVNTAGFISLGSGGYLDCLYVHPGYVNQGVAGALIKHLEDYARQQGIRQLTTHASLMAKDCFLSHGYEEIRINTVIRAGQALKNIEMKKELT